MGIYDRVIVQDVLKEMAMTSQIDIVSQKTFKVNREGYRKREREESLIGCRTHGNGSIIERCSTCTQKNNGEIFM